MLEALFCEIEWATEDEPSEEEKEAFRIEWFVYVSEVFERVDGGDGVEREAKRVKGAESEIGFCKVEDEAWLKYATCHVSWAVDGAAVEKGGFRRKRMAVIVPAGKIKKVREMVETAVGKLKDKEVNEDDVIDGDEEKEKEMT